MRSWLVVALLIATPLSTITKFSDGRTEQNSGKETLGEEKVVISKPRVFHVDLRFTVEQQDKKGDLIIEGKTIPGSTTTRIGSTLDLSDGVLLPLPAIIGDESTSFEIKINSQGNGTVRLAVSAKQSRKVSLEADESHSWNLKCEATKIVKLGQEVKLEFGDEKILGTKCVFEGVIVEKVQQKKR